MPGFLGLGKGRHEAEPQSRLESKDPALTWEDTVRMFGEGKIPIDVLEAKLTERLTPSFSGEVQLKLEVNKQLAEIWAAKIKELSSNSQSPADVLDRADVLILEAANSGDNDTELRRLFIKNDYSPLDASRMVRTVLELRKWQGQTTGEEPPILEQRSWYAGQLQRRGTEE